MKNPIDLLWKTCCDQYLRILLALQRVDVVGIFIFVGVNTTWKNTLYAKGNVEFNGFGVFSMYMVIYVSI